MNLEDYHGRSLLDLDVWVLEGIFWEWVGMGLSEWMDF
jgi:hypothetical protein